jgi:HEAT repeat protein
MKTKVTNRLCALLNEGIDVHRCAAARALGAIRLPQSTSALVAALLDDDADVRNDAAAALAEMQDPATAPKLMDNLIGDPDADVKKAVIAALVAMNHTPVIPLLRALAVTRSEDKVAWDEDAFYSEGWDEWVDIQIAAIKGLAAFADEEAVPAILAALADEMGQDVTEPAYEALAKMGEKGANALSAQYANGDARLRRRIAHAVGQSDNAFLDDLRSALLNDETPAIRTIMLKNLSATDTRLAPLFSDPDTEVRAAVVQHAGHKNRLLLWDMINDPASEVRTEVFKVIAANPEEFADKGLIEAVKKGIKGEPNAAKHAALALFALKGPKVAKGLSHVPGNTEIPHAFRLGVMATLEKAGKISVPALLNVAGDPDRQLRLASLTALANIATDDPVWPNDAGLGLLSALKGELVLPPEEEIVEEEPKEPEVVLNEAELDELAQEIDESLPLVAENVDNGSTLQAIMANKPDTPAEEPEEIILDETQQRLLNMTNTRKLSKRKVSWETAVAPYLDVQRFAARLLGQVVNTEVTAALIAALDADTDLETRDAVLFSLAKHGAKTGELPKDIYEPLLALLDSDQTETRVLATRVLGWLGHEDVTAKLEELLIHDDQLVRVEAVQALDHRNIYSAALETALRDEYLGVGLAAARALARISGDKAVDALVAYATQNDGIYRYDIGKLFGQYAPIKGAAALLALLNNEDQKINWLVAIDALAEVFQQPEPTEALMVA